MHLYVENVAKDKKQKENLNTRAYIYFISFNRIHFLLTVNSAV